jgi:hypothetical protein
MHDIFNPQKAAIGIVLESGRRIFLRPTDSTMAELSALDVARAGRKGLRVTEREESALEVRDNPETLPSGKVDETITNGQSLDLAFMTDDQLRALAASRSIKVHHKAGRAKLLAALGE